MDQAGTSSPHVAAPPPPPQTLDDDEPRCYVVTAHRPSAVLASVVCAFTSPEDLNLIISKVTRIEIHRVRQDGLEGIVDVPIYGRVAALKVVHPQGRKTAVILLVTESHQYSLLEWSPAGHLNTLAVGDARVQVARPRETGALAAVDATGIVVALHQYSGMLRLMQLSPDTCEIKSWSVERIDELEVLDMQFLSPESPGADPILGILHQDYRTKTRSFKTYAVSVSKAKPTLHDAELRAAHVDAGATFIVPAPADLGGGATLIGETSITHIARSKDSKATGAEQHREAIARNSFLCWAPVEGNASTLLADAAGRLHLMQLQPGSRGRVGGVQVHALGAATYASCMAYLDTGVVFIGSRVGNSQLLRLSETPQGPNQTFTQVLQEFTNLAPIVDFSVVDLDNVGQGQLVACCNTGSAGSLRLVRAGISIVEHAGIELEGIRGAWSIKGSTMAEHDQCLVITFLESTHVLAMNAAEELDEADVQGFVTDKMTLFCGSLDNDHTVQVTSEEVRLLDISTGNVVGSWQCPQGPIAKAAATGATHILVATGQGRLYLLETSPEGLKCIAEKELQDEVACIDIASWRHTGKERLAAVGTWNSKLLLLEVPSMSIVAEEKLSASDLPRSTLFMALGQGYALLLGLGDGQLAHWQVTEAHTLTTKKSVMLGLNPISLSAFRMGGCPYVFAATDRPAVVHEHNGKLVYSPLNESNVSHLCTFSTEALPGAVAMCKDDRLMITAIDAIQKLHVRTVPMQEQPRRIAYQPSTKSFAVITLSLEAGASFVRILSQSSWETVASLALDDDEHGTAVCTVPHPNNTNSELYVVGTGYIKEDEPEPSRGRLLLLQLSGTPGGLQELKPLFEQTVNGCVYSLAPIAASPGKFVATVNSQVSVFAADPAATRGDCLRLLCKAAGMILALYADVAGHTIVVGDLMRSIAVYAYNPDKQELTLVAKDFDTKWITAVAAISDTLFAAMDNSNSLMMMRYNHDAEDDSAKMALDSVLDYNLGDFVNRIKPGSLVMQLPDAEMARCPVYVSVSLLGMISLCIMLPKHRFQQLQALQTVLQTHIKGIGGLQHTSWRSRSAADSRGDMTPARNCIDGDLIEQLLDLSKGDMETIVSKIPPKHQLPLDELVKLIEELQRLH